MTDESIDVVAGIIRRGNEVLVAKRPRDTHLAGYWEFPGGKPEPGESDPETLKRELKEELDIDVSVRDSYYSVTHDYDERTVHLRFYTCSIQENATPEPVESEEIRWIPEQELSTLSFPPADNELITKLQQESSEIT